MRSPKTVFYPFSKGIPWTVSNFIIDPFLSSNIIDNHIKTKPINLLFPGYLLESLFVANLVKALNLNVNKFIMSSYYEDVFSLFGIKAIGNDNNIFDEYERLIACSKSYISPIFFDADDNVYYNPLFNYGDVADINNKFKYKNQLSCYNQIMNNCCTEYNLELDFDLNKNDKIDIDNYCILDLSNNIAGLADGRLLVEKFISQDAAREIAIKLKSIGLTCIILTSRKDIYYGINIIPFNSWDQIKAGKLLYMLSKAKKVISNDPNIYLTAAIAGCENILSLDKNSPGWCFDDIKSISKAENHNWKYIDEFNIQNILNYINEGEECKFQL